MIEECADEIGAPKLRSFEASALQARILEARPVPKGRPEKARAIAVFPSL